MAEVMSEASQSDQKPQQGFLDTLYSTLFHPISTFRALGETTPMHNRALFYALFTVIFVSAIAPLVKMANTGGQPADLVFAIPVSMISGVIIWAFMGLVTGLLAYAFTGQARTRTFLALSGLAVLPWILMGPVSILKFGIGPIGAGLCIFGALLIWLWSVLLFGLALMNAYRMTIERALILLATPFVAQLILLGWTMGFAGNIRQLAAHL